MQQAMIMVESAVLAVLVVLLVWGRARRWWEARREAGQAKRKKRANTLRPRTPRDCLDCRVEGHLTLPDTTRTTVAWREVKIRRGRPKVYDSDGQACMNPRCRYYRDTDGLHHALRRDGSGTRVKPRRSGSVGRVAANTRHAWGHHCID